MKPWMLVLGALLLTGCGTVEPVKNIIKDKEFANYKQSLDDVEHQYLKKQISYAQYLEQKQDIEESYQKEIDNRRDVIELPRAAESKIETAP